MKGNRITSEINTIDKVGILPTCGSQAHRSFTAHCHFWIQRPFHVPTSPPLPQKWSSYTWPWQMFRYANSTPRTTMEQQPCLLFFLSNYICQTLKYTFDETRHGKSIEFNPICNIFKARPIRQTVRWLLLHKTERHQQNPQIYKQHQKIPI